MTPAIALAQSLARYDAATRPALARLAVCMARLRRRLDRVGRKNAEVSNRRDQPPQPEDASGGSLR